MRPIWKWQFDFEYLVDRNGAYVTSFGTNHDWLVGEQLDNADGSIVYIFRDLQPEYGSAATTTLTTSEVPESKDNRQQLV
jgi:hypothetical protein